MATTRFEIILILLLVFPGWAVAEDVYIWTDQNGVTHIEDQAPKVSPGGKIKVEKHTFEKESGAPAVANPEIGPLPQNLSPEEVEAAAKQEQEEKEKALQKQEALEQARQEYEEAMESEKRYLYRYRNADNSKARHYWKGKLDDLEEKRQKLEALEKAE